MMLMSLVVLAFQRGQIWTPEEGQTPTPEHTKGRPPPRFLKVLICARTICEDDLRHCGDQNTTSQSRFMLTTVMP
jgi:hypothetical protein